MGIVLTLRGELYTWLDLSPLSPLAAEAEGAAESAAAILLPYGRGAVRTDAVFALSETDLPGLILCGDLRLGANLGEALADGAIRAEGSVGPNAGRGMTGGTLTLCGDAGDNAFFAMQNGFGLVFGAACSGACGRMRRGTVVLAKAGGALGMEMRGGTLLVKELLSCGADGAKTSVGAGMDRGTVILPAGVHTLPGFTAAAETSLPFLRFLYRELAAHGAPVNETDGDGAFIRFRGDSAALGKGEVFVPCAAGTGRKA